MRQGAGNGTANLRGACAPVHIYFLLRGRSGGVGAWNLCWGICPGLVVCSVLRYTVKVHSATPIIVASNLDWEQPAKRRWSAAFPGLS